MYRWVFLAAALLTMQACVSVRSSHGYILERGQTEIAGEPGLDNKESILAKYGEPSMIGTFNPNAWYYMTSLDTTRAFFHSKTKARSVVAFHFGDNGYVSKVDTFSLDDGTRLSLANRVTPTRGKELNFWEQLLGTVGRLPAGIGQEGPSPGQ